MHPKTSCTQLLTRRRVLQCDIYSFGVILWEVVTGGFATRGRLFDPVVRWALNMSLYPQDLRCLPMLRLPSYEQVSEPITCNTVDVSLHVVPDMFGVVRCRSNAPRPLRT